MKRIKKAVILLAAVVLLFTASVVLSGCEKKEYENEYFTYYIFDNGGRHVEITGLTEKGREQKILVIPEAIDGLLVTSLQRRAPWATHPPDFKSENLEKIFFPTSEINIHNETFSYRDKFKKGIVVNFKYDPYYGGGGGIVSAMDPIGGYHIPKSIYDIVVNYDGKKCANTTYYYNYETSINYGCYWIDDVEYGEKIEFIPPNPVRNGYNFGGWYKETECLNLWNFEADTLPEQLLDEEGKIVYQETALYAKWTKK